MGDLGNSENQSKYELVYEGISLSGNTIDKNLDNDKMICSRLVIIRILI